MPRRYAGLLVMGILLSIGVLQDPISSAYAAKKTITLIPKDTALDWQLMLTEGVCPDELCRLATDVAMEQKVQKPDGCRFLSEAASKDRRVHLPEWRRVDHRDRLPEIERITTDAQYFGPYSDFKVGSKAESPSALREEFWRRFGGAIMQVFERGDAVFETAEFDVDSDGEKEKIYRISLVEPVGAGPRIPIRSPPDLSHWQIKMCDLARMVPAHSVALSADVATHLHQVFPALAELFKPGGNTDVFLFDSKPYRFEGGPGGATITPLKPTVRIIGDLWSGLYLGSRSLTSAPNRQIWQGSK